VENVVAMVLMKGTVIVMAHNLALIAMKMAILMPVVILEMMTVLVLNAPQPCRTMFINRGLIML